MGVIRRVLLADQPTETRFFAFLGIFGLVLAVIYWFVSYEVAGTVLLFGFGLACTVGAVRLLVVRRTLTGRRVAATADEPGPDRPFLDEHGRLPGDTLAPLSVGLGVALSITAVVFGPWLLVAGLVPLGWGAWEWFRGA